MAASKRKLMNGNGGVVTEWEGEGKRMEITEWEVGWGMGEEITEWEVGEKRNGNY